MLFNTWMEAPLGVPPHAYASSAGGGEGGGEGGGAGGGAGAVASARAPGCRPRAEWSDAQPTRREGVGSGGGGGVKAKIWLLGDSLGAMLLVGRGRGTQSRCRFLRHWSPRRRAAPRSARADAQCAGSGRLGGGAHGAFCPHAIFTSAEA